MCLLLLLCFTGCSENKEYPELQLSQSSIRLKLKGDIFQPNPTCAITILGGNGNYKIDHPETFTHMLDAYITDNILHLTPKTNVETSIRMTISDGKEQKVPLEVKIEEEYLLMKVNKLQVLSEMDEAQQEILHQKAMEACKLQPEQIYEFRKEGSDYIVNQYNSRENLLSGNPDERGTFGIAFEPYRLLLHLNDRDFSYEMGNHSGIIFHLLDIFDMKKEVNSLNTRESSAFDPVQLLVCNMTGLCKEWYPEIHIEKVEVGIYTHLSSFKED